MRWFELLIGIHWLYERTREGWLRELADVLERQGYDWAAHFADFRYTERQQEWTYEAHVVNQAMALKEAALRYRFSGRAEDAGAAEKYIAILNRYHGQATGIFSGDECLAGRNPSQGTELCAVVEYLYSLETLLSILGAPQFAERLERIAFNALPATFTPDMWAHQYDQQANQVQCRIAEEHVYTTNGPDANIYGLMPNYPCCLANMHQGWPKFAASLWMRTEDGLAAFSYAPCRVACEVAGTPVHLEVATEYPFEETARITVTVAHPLEFTLHLRIPGWAEGASLTINGETFAPAPGTFHRLARRWEGETVLTLHLPMPVQVQRRFAGSAAITRGPLVYALNIGEEWRQVGGELPHADWEVYPTTPWNYALQLDLAHPEQSLQFTHHPSAPVPSRRQVPPSLHRRLAGACRNGRWSATPPCRRRRVR